MQTACTLIFIMIADFLACCVRHCENAVEQLYFACILRFFRYLHRCIVAVSVFVVTVGIGNARTPDTLNRLRVTRYEGNLHIRRIFIFAVVFERSSRDNNRTGSGLVLSFYELLFLGAGPAVGPEGRNKSVGQGGVDVPVCPCLGMVACVAERVELVVDMLQWL